VPLTAMVGADLWQSRRVGLVSGVLAIFAGPMLVYVPMVDSFAVFGVAGFTALYAATRAVRAPAGSWWLVVSGLAVGLATLTRIDGMLLAIAPAVAWFNRRGIGPWASIAPPLPWRAALASALAAVIVLAPWLLRQQLVFGTPFPSAGGHTLWITSYNEQFSIGHPVDLGTYLASGPAAIVASKLTSWGLLIGRTAVLLGGAFIISFAYGLWRDRRRPELAPFLAYWVVLFVVMGALFTLHAPQGAWYHSAWAWLPFAIPLAVASFIPAVERLGRSAPMFARSRNQTFLFRAAVAGAVVLSLVGSFSLIVGWRGDRQRLDAAASFLEAQARPDDVVMYIDPPSLTLATGLRSVPFPYDPFPVIESVARAYDVRWVVVERERGRDGDALGLWNGGGSVDVDGNSADFLLDSPAFDASDVRVYEVRH
jgi:hypothetical protein